jgi:hypothetical protein
MILKPLQTEITITSANTVYDSKLIRVYAESNTVVTIVSESANTSFSMVAGSVEIVEKLPADTLQSVSNIRCTPVSYKS